MTINVYSSHIDYGLSGCFQMVGFQPRTQAAETPEAENPFLPPAYVRPRASRAAAVAYSPHLNPRIPGNADTSYLSSS